MSRSRAKDSGLRGYRVMLESAPLSVSEPLYFVPLFWLFGPVAFMAGIALARSDGGALGRSAGDAPIIGGMLVVAGALLTAAALFFTVRGVVRYRRNRGRYAPTTIVHPDGVED